MILYALIFDFAVMSVYFLRQAGVSGCLMGIVTIIPAVRLFGPLGVIAGPLIASLFCYAVAAIIPYWPNCLYPSVKAGLWLGFFGRLAILFSILWGLRVI